MRLSLEQIRTLAEISPLAKEIGAKTRWRRMTDEELWEKLLRLHSLIGELLQSLPQPKPEPEPELAPQPAKELWQGKITYRREWVKCGAKCKCNGGKGHGPYWYAYWREGGKLKKRRGISGRSCLGESRVD